MPAGIFISYRRQEALKEARAIYERLLRAFGVGSAFIDLEGLQYGEDFAESLQRQLKHCQVLLALIGPQWLALLDGRGRRRLDDESDFVRIELRTALESGIHVVPVLLDGAAMPSTSDLPVDLQPLSRRQAFELDFRKFDSDIGRLVQSLRLFLKQSTPENGLRTDHVNHVITPTTQPIPEYAPIFQQHPEPILPPSPTFVGTLPLRQLSPGGTTRSANGRRQGVKSTTWITIFAGAIMFIMTWVVTYGEKSGVPATADSLSAANPMPASSNPVTEHDLPMPPPEALRPTNSEDRERIAEVVTQALTKKPPTGPSAATPLVVGQRFRDCDEDACPWMVVLPEGVFLMGSPENELERNEDEGPQHRVQVASFAMGQYEVTFLQWDACVASGGCTTKPNDQGWGRGQRPVVNVSWGDAQQFAKWLSSKTGHTYRLPSEAEWEYAARAGTTTPFSFGERITTAQANFDGSYTYNGSARGVYRRMTLPVGKLSRNNWDLYDLHGNVYEWVQDCWHENYHGARTNSRPWLAGCDGVDRIIRGGGWSDRPRVLRAASRILSDSNLRGFSTGFRLVRDLP